MISKRPTRDRPWRHASWWWCGVAVFLSALAWAGPTTPELLMAQARLRDGRYRMAAAGFQAVLEHDPDNPDARAGLARAWAAAHLCSDALPLLSELRPHGPWSARLAAAEGDCRADSGDLAGALSAYDEAVWLDARGGYPWMRLEAAARQLGEVDRVTEAREALLVLDGGPLVVLTAEAEQAVAEARPEADALLLELARYRSAGPQVSARLARLDGRRWLDVGWPERAAAVLVAGLVFDLHDPELAAWHAEALRRSGDAHTAREVLERPAIVRQDPTAVMRAIAARIAVDEGRPDDAAALLEVTLWHPELLASRWYLAVALGDDASPWRERWTRADPGYGRRTLDTLLVQEVP